MTQWFDKGNALIGFLVCLCLILPASGQAKIYGFYSAGCFDQPHRLQPDGVGYQAVRLSRRRTFSHPALEMFLKKLTREVAVSPKKLVLLGDISKEGGGQMKGAHASHQIGLDSDIWFWHPPEAEKRLLSLEERETLSARSVVNAKMTGLDPSVWRPYHMDLLKMAASEPEVQRIFVNAVIKKELCKKAGKNRGWLRKIRPWYGHNFHFHVRLYCPTNEDRCQTQEDPPAGDGCNEVAAWVEEVQLNPTLEIPIDAEYDGLIALPRECARIIKKNEPTLSFE